jgi:hypothetical protein
LGGRGGFGTPPQISQLGPPNPIAAGTHTATALPQNCPPRLHQPSRWQTDRIDLAFGRQSAFLPSNMSYEKSNHALQDRHFRVSTHSTRGIARIIEAKARCN